MTKRFCDICGDAALEDPRMERLKDIGKPWTGGIPLATRQPAIRTTINFAWTNREDGFGSSPDLCDRCRLELVKNVINSKNL